MATRLCRYQGICGMPEDHAGEHVPDHALVQCLDPTICTLCISRSNTRLARYGLTTESLNENFRKHREHRASLQSPTGCINCPICHTNFDPMHHSEISADHMRLFWLEQRLQRS